MRILLVHARHRAPGGEDVAVDVEEAALRGAGHDVLRIEHENPHGVATLTKFAGAPWNVVAAREVGAEAKRFAPDVVHLHNTWFALSPSVLPALAATGAPVVETLHNYRHMCLNGTFVRADAVCHDCLGRSPAAGIGHRCYRGSVPGSLVAATTAMVMQSMTRRHVTHYVAPSYTVRDLHVAAGFSSDDITVVEHGVADTGPRSTPPSKSNRVVWIGRLAPGKGIEGLLRAWRDHAPAGLELDVLGDGPLRDRLVPVLPPGVRLHGHVNRETVLSTLDDARAFLFTSEWEEPFGLVLLEAMSTGTPIVGFATADTERIVGPGGTLVPIGDHVGLLRAVGALSAPDLDAASQALRSRFAAHYTDAAHLERLLAVFERFGA